MKTQIISMFKEKPKTKIGWWAMGLGLATLLGLPLVSFFTIVIHPLITSLSEESSYAIGINLGIFSLIASAAGVVAGIFALRKGERSWLVWLGFILALVTLIGFLFMMLADLLIPQ